MTALYFGLSALEVLCVVWIGFDHRRIVTDYGHQYVSRSTAYWVILALLWPLIPVYLFQRRRQRRNPMWPVLDGSLVIAVAADGTYWCRAADGAWSTWSTTRQDWQRRDLRRVPEGLRWTGVSLPDEAQRALAV